MKSVDKARIGIKDKVEMHWTNGGTETEPNTLELEAGFFSSLLAVKRKMSNDQ